MKSLADKKQSFVGQILKVNTYQRDYRCLKFTEQESQTECRYGRQKV
jgi:hypothetical protein